MKRVVYLITAVAALMLLVNPVFGAEDEDAARVREEAELQAAYEEALVAAEREREAAMEAVERAQEEVQRAAEERARADQEVSAARRDYLEQQAEARGARQDELAAMRQELSRAHEELRRASREVAQVHRELERSQRGLTQHATRVNLGDRAVIGVVLGGDQDNGVRVLGVSPDGPAERAGIEQGDVIVAVEGEALASDGEGEATRVLLGVLEGVEAGDELRITVNRDGDSLEYTVTAERREPYGWANIVRLPSLPEIPGAPLVVERIEIPEIDQAALAEQVERIREDLDRTRVVLEARQAEGFPELEEGWEFEFENLSDVGEEIMINADVWFGMPLTRGLKLSRIDAGLGAYFDTDRGVLVLEAKKDNGLKLLSGDVILNVGGIEVDRPADVMRALRDLEPGSDLRIEIMRERKGQSIDIVVPERRGDFSFTPGSAHEHDFYYHFDTPEN